MRMHKGPSCSLAPGREFSLFEEFLSRTGYRSLAVSPKQPPLQHRRYGPEEKVNSLKNSASEKKIFPVAINQLFVEPAKKKIWH
jgi:hypothetical protein